MPRTVLSPEAMQEGIEAMLERRIPLGEFNDPEFDKKIEKSIQEKIDEGYEWGQIIYPIFIPFFLSKDDEIKEARQRFVEECGGEENIEFYRIDGKDEIFVLMK